MRAALRQDVDEDRFDVPTDPRGWTSTLAVTNPDFLEARYRELLFGRIEEMRKAVEANVVPAIRDIAESLERRADGFRIDGTPEGDAQHLRRMTDLAELRFGRGNPLPESEVQTLGQDVSEHNKGELEEDFGRIAKVQPEFSDGNTDRRLQTFARENLSLIKDVDESTFDDLATHLADAVREGTRPEELEELIGERLSVAETRAKTIARDQVSKLNSDFNRVRQRENGVERYEWMSAADRRVRESHAFLHGNIRAWSNPHPTEGHPGDPVNCRCVARGIVEDLLSEGRRREAQSRAPSFEPQSFRDRRHNYNPNWPTEGKAKFLQTTWAHGSWTATSVALKQAAAEQFDLAGKVWNPKGHDVDRSTVDDMKSVVEHQYQRTQQELDQRGVETVTLYRGLSEEVEERGAVSSWTQSREVAESFDDHVIEEEIPAERVLYFRGGPNWKDGKYGNQEEWVVLSEAPGEGAPSGGADEEVSVEKLPEGTTKSVATGEPLKVPEPFSFDLPESDKDELDEKIEEWATTSGHPPPGFRLFNLDAEEELYVWRRAWSRRFEEGEGSEFKKATRDFAPKDEVLFDLAQTLPDSKRRELHEQLLQRLSDRKRPDDLDLLDEKSVKSAVFDEQRFGGKGLANQDIKKYLRLYVSRLADRQFVDRLNNTPRRLAEQEIRFGGDIDTEDLTREEALDRIETVESELEERLGDDPTESEMKSLLEELQSSSGFDEFPYPLESRKPLGGDEETAVSDLASMLDKSVHPDLHDTKVEKLDVEVRSDRGAYRNLLKEVDIEGRKTTFHEFTHHVHHTNRRIEDAGKHLLLSLAEKEGKSVVELPFHDGEYGFRLNAFHKDYAGRLYREGADSRFQGKTSDEIDPWDLRSLEAVTNAVESLESPSRALDVWEKAPKLFAMGVAAVRGEFGFRRKRPMPWFLGQRL